MRTTAGWWWTLYVKKPGDLDIPDSGYDDRGYWWPWLDDDFPGTAVSHHCQWWWDVPSRWFTHNSLCQGVALYPNELVPIKKSTSFQLLPGQSFQLFVDVSQIKECDSCLTYCLGPYAGIPSYPGYVEKSCAMRDQQTYTFEDLIGGGHSTKFKDFALSARDPDPDPNSASNCSGHVYVEIETE